MQAVHLVECHNIEHLLHFVLVEEVACDIHHESAVSELRLVSNGYERNLPFCLAVQFLAE